jgi:hypothetical protein
MITINLNVAMIKPLMNMIRLINGPMQWVYNLVRFNTSPFMAQWTPNLCTMVDAWKSLLKVWLPYIARFQNPRRVSLPFCISTTTYYNTSSTIKARSPKTLLFFPLKIRLEIGWEVVITFSYGMVMNSILCNVFMCPWHSLCHN